MLMTKYINACFCLLALLMGHVTFAEDSHELNALMKDAMQGDAEKQLSLAYHYRDGKKGERDLALALQWAHKSADQGNTAAMDFVGYAYLTGRGVEMNEKVAFGYFHAAAQESEQAAKNLGDCYFSGRGITQDIPKALKAWGLAARKGNAKAAVEAAMVYLSGEGIPADPAEARRLAQIAADADYVTGLVILGELYFQEGKVEEAKEIWTKAAKMRRGGPAEHPVNPTNSSDAQQAADLLYLIPYRLKQKEGAYAYIESQHVHQGWNNCGASSATMLARFQGNSIGAWDFKRLCRGPIGTGTDWSDLVAAGNKLKLNWELVTFSPDDQGFIDGTKFLRSELDAGRPCVIDFKYYGPQYTNGEAGHSLAIVGYIASDDYYILRNPAIGSPGLQLITAADLKKVWNSNYYAAVAKGQFARPLIVIKQ